LTGHNRRNIPTHLLVSELNQFLRGWGLSDRRLWPEISALRDLVAAFAALLTPEQDNPARLQAWMDCARSSDMPHVHSFVRGLNQDLDAVNAALSTPHHNGRTEGVNTRTKMIKRQMYGRARFSLLRHRVLLG
jgi:transposase